MANRRPTISDVARVAEVSEATVSRALRGITSVDASLAERVKAAAERLGYTPNPIAQDLRFGSSRAIGIMVPDLANPYFARLVRVISRAAAVEGYRTLLSDTDENPDEELAALGTLARHVDGVVMCSPRMSDADLARAARSSQPLVMTARASPGVGINAVTVDSYRDCTELIGHLYKLGHRRLAYVSGPDHSRQNTERARAAIEAGAFGMECAVVAGGTEIVDGHKAVEAALETAPTAIVTFSDMLAVGVYEALRERAIAIPDELSVASFDDTSLAAHLIPALTTVRSQREEIGHRALGALMALINGEEIPATNSLAAELVLRESTAPVPGGRTRIA